MDMSTIITILALANSAFTMYFSFKKVSNNAQSVTEWRTTVNNDLKETKEIIREIKDSNKEIRKEVKEITEKQIKQDGEIESIKRDMKAIWKNIDEMKAK